MGMMRFLLAMAVVAWHAAPTSPIPLIRADLAVEAFFVISGFYMTLTLNTKYDPTISSTKRYLKNRFLRIFPIYWICLALTALATAVVYLTGSQGRTNVLASLPQYASLSGTAAALLTLSNVFIVGQDVLMFFSLDQGRLKGHLAALNEAFPAYRLFLIPQAWSLSIEFVFYICAPFLVRRAIGSLILLTAISFVVKAALFASGFNYDPWSYRFLPSEFGFFLIGSIVCRLFVIDKHIHRPLIRNRWSVSVLALLVLFGARPFGHLTTGNSNHFLVALVTPLAITLLIPSLFDATKNSRTDKFMGDLAYPIYISHLLPLAVMAQIWPSQAAMPLYAKLIAPVSILLFAMALMILVERPLDRWRHSAPENKQPFNRH